MFNIIFGIIVLKYLCEYIDSIILTGGLITLYNT